MTHDPDEPPTQDPPPAIVEYRGRVKQHRSQVNVWAVLSFVMGLLTLSPCVLTLVSLPLRSAPLDLPPYTACAAALLASIFGFFAISTDGDVRRGEVGGMWMAWFGLAIGLCTLSVVLILTFIRYATLNTP